MTNDEPIPSHDNVEGQDQGHSQGLSVCIATYRRLDELARLLSALASVRHPTGVLRWERTLVLDNSPDAEARQLVETQWPSLDLDYLHVPEPGLSAVRNAAISNAGTPWVAFVDDDEVPSADWLVELDRTLADYPEARAVMGPVQYAFEMEAPAWLDQARLFEVVELAKGESPEYFATGNAMLRTDLVDDLGPLFDPFFGDLGGEDHHLGLRLEAAGCQIVSAPEAVVVEHVPPDRMQPRWAARRLLRKGGSLANCDVQMTSGLARLRQRVRHLGRGAARIVVGLGLVASTPFVPGRTVWMGARFLLMGLGECTAAVGRPVGEYRRTNTRSAG